MNRIIGVGNRWVDQDAAGPRVCAWLRRASIPAGIEVSDGGLGGLNLLGLFDGMERVVLVDQVSGFCPGGGTVILTAGEAAALAPDHHGHGSGIAYLLNALAATSDDPRPEVHVVGIEGHASPERVRQAAELAVALASGQSVNEP